MYNWFILKIKLQDIEIITRANTADLFVSRVSLNCKYWIRERQSRSLASHVNQSHYNTLMLHEKKRTISCYVSNKQVSSSLSW